MLARIVAYTQLIAKDHARDLGPELLFRITFASKWVPQVAGKPGSMSRPMPQLVERGRIISVGAGKLPLLGQVDAVRPWPVESPITSVMGNFGAGGLQYALGPLN